VASNIWLRISGESYRKLICHWVLGSAATMSKSAVQCIF
jgi:hypothetical protein